MNIDFITHMPPLLATVLMFVGFVLFWGIVVTLISRVSRWNKLAEVYPDMTTGEQCEKKRFGGVRMNNFVNYNGTITFEGTSLGLRMKQIFFFKIGHENLLIPWGDIEKKEHSRVIIGFRFAREPKTKILTTKKIGEWILQKQKKFLP